MARYEPSGASVGAYAIFVGGSYRKPTYTGSQYYNYYDVSDYVDAYNSSLTRSTATSRYSRGGAFSASNGKLAVFIGNHSGAADNYTQYINAFDTSLTQHSTQMLDYAAVHAPSGIGFGDYIMIHVGLYWWGEDSISESTDVFVYDSSLTKVKTVYLTKYRFAAITSKIEDKYALFAAGYNYETSTGHNTIDTFNKSLTRGTAPNLTKLTGGGGITVGEATMPKYLDEHALFTSSTYSSVGPTYKTFVEDYDTSLVHALQEYDSRVLGSYSVTVNNRLIMANLSTTVYQARGTYVFTEM